MSKTCFDSGFLRYLDVESKQAIGRSLAVPLVKDRALAATLTSSHLLLGRTSKIRNNGTARILRLLKRAVSMNFVDLECVVVGELQLRGQLACSLGTVVERQSSAQVIIGWLLPGMKRNLGKGAGLVMMNQGLRDDAPIAKISHVTAV
jgi:hypothetical protein